MQRKLIVFVALVSAAIGCVSSGTGAAGASGALTDASAGDGAGVVGLAGCQRGSTFERHGAGPLADRGLDRGRRKGLGRHGIERTVAPTRRA